MARMFSVASWNVEHLESEESRVQRVVNFLDAQSPDVFGLFEVGGKTVFDALVSTMPKDERIGKFSDHSLVFCEVHTP